jgi:pilus assembly protein FimV
MAIDRNSVIKEAQKLAGKGQFDKAIAEWRKLVKEAPNDANIFNTIGDLCLKKNAKAEAVDAYKRAADILAEDGFTSKAIALYKKVLNIDPEKIEVHLALGDMNADKGLTGNALESYKKVADHYKKKSDMPRALGIYQKMADLNPTNIAFRMKLAEMYLKEGMQNEAVKAYLDAADQHVAKDAFHDARQNFEKVLAIEPDNKEVYHKAGIVYFKEGKFAEACKALKPAFESDPDNQDLINLYLEALTKAGRAGDADEVYKKVLSHDPSRYDLHEKLYQIYIARKDYDKALKEAVMLADRKAEGMDFEGAAAVLKEFIAVTHDPVAGAVALAELFSKAGRAADGARELMQAADALIKRGSTDDAREVLGRASLLAPDLHEVKERFEGLAGAAPAVPAAPAAADPAEEPSLAVEELAIPEVSVPVAAPPVAEAPEEADSPAVFEALTEVDVLIKYGLGAKAVEQLEGIVRKYPEHPRARARLLDLYRDQQNTMKAVVQALLLAELYEKKGRNDESQSVLRSALELAPGNPQIMAKLGMAGAETEPEAPEAIETIEEPEAIETIPEVPELAIPGLESLELETPAEEDIEELEVPDEAPDEEIAAFEEPPAEPSMSKADAVPEEAEEISFEDEVAVEEPEEEAPQQRGRAGRAYQPPAAEEEPLFEQTAVVQEMPSETDIAELWAEAEFYYQQGLFDEARKHYEKILDLKPGERRAMERVVEITREKEEYQEFSRLADAVEGLESMVKAGPGASGEAVSQADADSVRSLMQEITEMRKGKTAAPSGKAPVKKAPEPVKPPRREEPEESFADIDTELPDAAAPTAAPAPAAPAAARFTDADSEESFADIDRELRGAGARPGSKAPAPAPEPARSGDPSDFFDLAAELRDELSASPAQKTPAMAHEQSLDEIFEEFKAGVEAHEKKEDEDTHYNLGVAYREMGLLDDAVSEFNMTNEGEPKFIQSRYMLGLCYLEKGDFETAITEIQNALGYSYSFGEASEERIGMHYDLGLAFQGIGNSASALEEFQKVYNLDSTYREVETKVHELQQGDFVSMDAIKEDIEKEISFKFLEEGARIEREEKTKKSRK